MFNFWAQRKQQKQAAIKLYDSIVKQARVPAFYQNLSVPDTADGRFDLILVHAFLVHYRVKDEQGAKKLAQNLFDHMFREFDKALREMGVGDLKVPRQMKYMMKSYKGRLLTYLQALDEGGDLKEALRRNLYRKVEDVTDETLVSMENYIKNNISSLEQQERSAINDGEIAFKDI